MVRRYATWRRHISRSDGTSSRESGERETPHCSCGDSTQSGKTQAYLEAVRRRKRERNLKYSLIPKEPLDTQSLDFPPVATHTLPGATGSAPEGAENPELPTRETPPSTELDSGHAADTDFQETKTEDLTPETKGPSSKRWSGEDQNVWEGNREEAELYFATYLINGIDTIFEKKTKAPFSGKMRVTDLEGKLLGEFEVLNGRMNGEEVYFDANGVVTERAIWENGKRIN